jgi:aconitate hydratase A / 2-methylisocitrate dehydratase
MGVLPLEFTGGETRKSLELNGRESYSIEGLAAGVGRRQKLKVRVSDAGRTREFEVLARIDTPEEVEYVRHGGILPYVLRELLQA